MKDKGILEELSAGYVSDYDGSYATTSNTNDAFNVFKFMADNTKVEWGLNGYSTKGGSQYLLRTSHSDESIKRFNGSFSELDMFFTVHSHPYGSEEGVSGFHFGPPPNYKPYYDVKSDIGVVNSRYKLFSSNNKAYPSQFLIQIQMLTLGMS